MHFATLFCWPPGYLSFISTEGQRLTLSIVYLNSNRMSTLNTTSFPNRASAFPIFAMRFLPPVSIHLGLPMLQRLATHPLCRDVSTLSDFSPVPSLPVRPIRNKVLLSLGIIIRKISHNNHRLMATSTPPPSHDFPSPTVIHMDELRIIVSKRWALLPEVHKS